MNVGGIKTKCWAKVNTQRGLLFIVKLIIIAKSVHELHLKASKQIAFANSPEPFSESVDLSTPEPEPQ